VPKCPNCGRNVDSSYQAQCSHCGAGLAMAPTGVPSTHTDLFGIPQGVSDPPAMPVPSSQDQPNKAGKVAKRFGAATVVRVAIVLVVLGGGAVWNWFTGARRDDSGAITDAGGLDVFRMAVGDCLDWPGGSDSEATEVERVEGKPCSEPHDLEVYALIDHPASAGDPYPGDDAVYTWGVEQCLPLFIYLFRTQFMFIDFFPHKYSGNPLDRFRPVADFQLAQVLFIGIIDNLGTPEAKQSFPII